MGYSPARLETLEGVSSPSIKIAVPIPDRSVALVAAKGKGEYRLPGMHRLWQTGYRVSPPTPSASYTEQHARV